MLVLLAQAGKRAWVHTAFALVAERSVGRQLVSEQVTVRGAGRDAARSLPPLQQVRGAPVRNHRAPPGGHTGLPWSIVVLRFGFMFCIRPNGKIKIALLM